MERVYALGVSVIEFLQHGLSDYGHYFEFINDISNPHYVLEILFPLLGIVDSVFAAQLVLCIAFGNWLNAVAKWWFLEDRPYWWVRETDFYPDGQRPVLRQTHQTCETGPGCPSGHTETIAMVLVLVMCWIVHVMHDRRCYVWWWKIVAYPIATIILISVMMARMFVAAHFLHQTLLGALLGAFLAPALCIYVSDPYIWHVSWHANSDVSRTMFWHVVSAVLTALIGYVTYLGLIVCGWDPMWTVKLALKWCASPDYIHIKTTPMFAFIHSTGHLLGWALCVTPAVAQYRHNSNNRSLILATISTGMLVYFCKLFQSNIPKETAWKFYTLHFLVCTIKPVLLLRISPWLAMWPYSGKEKIH